MRILITGGCGFVGTNVIAAFVERPGVELRVLDIVTKRSPWPPLQHAKVEFLVGDIRDTAAVKRAVEGMDAIVHLAARPGIVDSIESPADSFGVNVVGTFNLIEAARQADVGQFVLASSNAAVGDHEPPIHESLAPHPISPYGASKTAGEALLTGYAEAFGLGGIALRFSNVYGPYCSHKQSVVAAFCRAACSGDPITIHGDGAQTRDFLFVDDLCQAIWLALTSSPQASVFQIASGVESSIAEVATAIAELAKADLGIDVPVQFGMQRAGDVRRNVSSVELARAQLGYEPQTPLREGLQRTWDWYRRAAVVELASEGVLHG